MTPNDLRATVTPEAELRSAADHLRRLAFRIPAPNDITPQLVMLALGLDGLRLRLSALASTAAEGEGTT